MAVYAIRLAISSFPRAVLNTCTIAPPAFSQAEIRMHWRLLWAVLSRYELVLLMSARLAFDTTRGVAVVTVATPSFSVARRAVSSAKQASKAATLGCTMAAVSLKAFKSPWAPLLRSSIVAICEFQFDLNVSTGCLVASPPWTTAPDLPSLFLVPTAPFGGSFGEL